MRCELVSVEAGRPTAVSEERWPELPGPRRGRLGSILRVLGRPSHLYCLSRDLLGVGRQIGSDLEHLDATMGWLRRAQDMTGCGGVSAGYYLADGWLPPYPETTGYIIPTFLQYASFQGKQEYFDRAVRMGDWEIEIQLPEGGVRGGIGINRQPIVFNTGQAILGWVQLYGATGDDRFLDAARAAADWLLGIQDEDGKWSRCTHENVPHAYHSRVAWALLEVHEATGIQVYREAGEANVRWVLSQANERAWFARAGFWSGQRPYTHTIAYTLRGLLEGSSHFAGSLSDRIQSVVWAAAETLMMSYERSKRTPTGTPRFLPGAFDENWLPTETSSCLTGNAQMAIVWMKLYRLTDDARFLNAALKILDQVKATQSLRSRQPGIRGGVSGSYPMWRSYERLGYPNWAGKFFADALMLAHAIMADLEGEAS